MSSVVNIKQLFKKLRITTNNQVRERILGDALLALETAGSGGCIHWGVRLRDLQIQRLAHLAGITAMFVVTAAGAEYIYYVLHLQICGH